MTRYLLVLILATPLSLLAQEEKEPPAAERTYRSDRSDQDLAKQKFKGENLDNVNFEGADLSEAELDEASVRESNFRAAVLEGASVWMADLTGSDFRQANLKYLRCGHANFSKCDLSGVDLSATVFLNNNLREANLRNLKGINQVTKCDFTGADLRGANLTGALAAETAKWRKAKYDRSTRWPKGFDPEAAGCVLAEEEAKPAKPAKGSKAPATDRAAREKKFSSLDINADGVLSGKEMRPYAELDANGDDEVSLDEFLAGEQ